jgi:hypothetical protein
MTSQDLGPLHVHRKSGAETFRSANEERHFTLLDFWQWSGSDLLDNTYRGVLAEFLVAKALGIPTSGVRQSWTPFDLQTSDGVKVEVKSAGYLQTWGQRRLSTVQFVVPKRRGFDAVANELEETPSRHADVYVFALLAHEDKQTVDPLQLDQWRFYALSARRLDERKRSQHSISLRSLEAMTGPAVGFSHIEKAVRDALLADAGTG